MLVNAATSLNRILRLRGAVILYSSWLRLVLQDSNSYFQSTRFIRKTIRFSWRQVMVSVTELCENGSIKLDRRVYHFFVIPVHKQYCQNRQSLSQNKVQEGTISFCFVQNSSIQMRHKLLLHSHFFLKLMRHDPSLLLASPGILSTMPFAPFYFYLSLCYFHIGEPQRERVLRHLAVLDHNYDHLLTCISYFIGLPSFYETVQLQEKHKVLSTVVCMAATQSGIYLASNRQWMVFFRYMYMYT